MVLKKVYVAESFHNWKFDIMPQHSFPDFYDGTSRPGWAGPVEIITEQVRTSRVHTDARSSQQDWIERPTSVSGIILPVGTKGRHTSDVIERDLAGRPEDRGHMMALSLGGPDTEFSMVAQPRQMNQKFDDGGEEFNPLDRITWRALEVYLTFHAYEVMAARQMDPEWNTPERMVHVKLWLNQGQPYFLCNCVPRQDFTSHNFNTTDLWRQSMPTTFKLHYEARIHYRNTDRGNDATGVAITHSILAAVGPIVSHEHEFPFEFQEQDLARVLQVEEEARRRQQEERQAQQYRQQHLRSGDT